MGILSLIFNILSLLVLARVVISWIRPDPYNPIVQFIHQATEPMLEPIRRILPPAGGLDFSPIVLILLLSVIQTLLVNSF